MAGDNKWCGIAEAHDVHVPCKRQLARHLVQNMPPKPPVRVVLAVWDWVGRGRGHHSGGRRQGAPAPVPAHAGGRL